jgi:hypothetical protein
VLDRVLIRVKLDFIGDAHDVVVSGKLVDAVMDHCKNSFAKGVGNRSKDSVEVPQSQEVDCAEPYTTREKFPKSRQMGDRAN